MIMIMINDDHIDDNDSDGNDKHHHLPNKLGNGAVLKMSYWINRGDAC